MACTKRPVKILRFDQNEVSDAEYLKMISHSQVDVDQIPIEISDTKIRKGELWFSIRNFAMIMFCCAFQSDCDVLRDSTSK